MGKVQCIACAAPSTADAGCCLQMIRCYASDTRPFDSFSYSLSMIYDADMQYLKSVTLYWVD